MTVSPVTPATPTTPARSRSAQAILVALAALLLVTLAYRAYGPRVGARPTELLAATLVDLNRGDRVELQQVPGIGPSLAEKIVGHRDQHGPFRSLEELQRVPGVGGKTLDKLRPWLTVGGVAAVEETEAATLERKPSSPPLAKPSAPGRGGKIQSGEPAININVADAAALQRLPGVGPTLAARIVEARTAKPFASVEDLRKVRGIGVKTLESLRPHVCCE